MPVIDRRYGITRHRDRAIFPLGIYEQPRNRSEWDKWEKAGINLLCCHDEEQLEQAHRRGMLAWVPAPVICKDTEGEKNLAERVKSLRDHPAIVCWEAQDEAIWNACRLDDGIVTNRVWAQTPEVKGLVRSRLDALVAGLQNGSSIVRGLDPCRRIWLNEAAKSDQETLARCLPYLDVVGYDYYPVPEDPDRGRQMHMLAGYTQRFRTTAPSKDVWVVEQAFSWGGISRASFGKPSLIHDYNTNSWVEASASQSAARPGVEECRFMAWVAVSHGAAGLLWYGSAYEEKRDPLLNDLLVVVEELGQLQSFLTAGNVTRVRAITDERHCPPVMGVSAVVRRSQKGTLLALINEDYTDHDVAVTGMDWIDAGDLDPILDPSDDLRSSGNGMLTRMQGHEVRIYVTD